MNIENAMLNDQELDNISGGGLITTPNMEAYYLNRSNSDTPRYGVGDVLTMKYQKIVDATPEYNCTCVVRSVSSTRDAGWMDPEFSYTVEIIAVSKEVALMDNTLVGNIYTGVYESCLYRR